MRGGLQLPQVRVHEPHSGKSPNLRPGGFPSCSLQQNDQRDRTTHANHSSKMPNRPFSAPRQGSLRRCSGPAMARAALPLILNGCRTARSVCGASVASGPIRRASNVRAHPPAELGRARKHAVLSRSRCGKNGASLDIVAPRRHAGKGVKSSHGEIGRAAIFASKSGRPEE